jgi:hypothetical protein
MASNGAATETLATTSQCIMLRKAALVTFSHGELLNITNIVRIAQAR